MREPDSLLVSARNCINMRVHLFYYEFIVYHNIVVGFIYGRNRNGNREMRGLHFRSAYILRNIPIVF